MHNSLISTFLCSQQLVLYRLVHPTWFMLRIWAAPLAKIFTRLSYSEAHPLDPSAFRTLRTSLKEKSYQNCQRHNTEKERKHIFCFAFGAPRESCQWPADLSLDCDNHSDPDKLKKAWRRKFRNNLKLRGFRAIAKARFFSSAFVGIAKFYREKATQVLGCKHKLRQSGLTREGLFPGIPSRASVRCALRSEHPKLETSSPVVNLFDNCFLLPRVRTRSLGAPENSKLKWKWKR